jgi:hypothetical protein
MSKQAGFASGTPPSLCSARRRWCRSLLNFSSPTELACD